MSNIKSQERDICSKKHKGNANSKAANKTASKAKLFLRQEVYELIFWSTNGLSCEELALMLSRPVHSISGRISELKAEGEIVEVSERKSRFGVPCGVYKATCHAKRAA